MAKSILMSLCALKVSVLVPTVLSSSSTVPKVMSPSSPPPLPVVIVTFAPPDNASVIKKTPSVELSAVDKNGLALLIPTKPLPATMVMLFGSISHSPPEPLTAVTSGVLVTLSVCLPDVSTNPPLPEIEPPVALIAP